MLEITYYKTPEMNKINIRIKYNMKKFCLPLIFSICFTIISISSFGQTIIPVLNEATDQLNMNKPINSQENLIELNQQGNSNQTVITQGRLSQFDLPNQAILNQNGFQNIMMIDQNTTNGEIDATQNGNFNNLDLSIFDGESLNLNILQNGNNNEIKQTHFESVDVNLNLFQLGDNHSIEQIYNSQTGINMTIIQKGQNAAIRIKHN